MSTGTPTRMTGDEFLRVYGDQSGYELVSGILQEMPMPGGIHGEVCGNAYALIREAVKANRAGRVYCNDTFVRTRTSPDGYRGADVAFISYQTLPAEQPSPRGPLIPPFELVVEVRSPSDTMAVMSDKAQEYLEAGVRVVVVLDPDTESAGVYRLNEIPHRVHNGDELTITDVLPGFAVPVKRFFE